MNPDYVLNQDEQKGNRNTDGSSMMEIERRDGSENREQVTISNNTMAKQYKVRFSCRILQNIYTTV